MKKLTVEQLQALTWTCIAHTVDETNCDHDVTNEMVGEDENGPVFEDKNWFNRAAYGSVTLQAVEDQDIKIEFVWEATHEEKNTYEGSFDFDLAIHSDVPDYIKLVGADLVDDDGDEISGWDCRSELSEIVEGCEWENMVRHDLPTPETEEIEMSGEGEEFVVERDNAPDLKFKGELVASATSKDRYNDGGRWTNLYLYKTTGGKFVCHQEGVTLWQGERTKNKAEVCTNTAEIIAWFGQGRVAKELYGDASIENVESID